MDFLRIQEAKDLRLIRALSIFSALSYWGWYFYYYQLFDTVTDFFWVRVGISLFSAMVYYLITVRHWSLPRIRGLYRFALWIHLIYELLLVGANHWNPIFIFTYLAVALIVSSCSLSIGDFLSLSIAAIFLPVCLHFFIPQDIHLLMHMIVCSVAIFLLMGMILRSNFSYRDELSGQHVSIVQNSKMVALGQMAAGIAHEINNPLAIINGRASILQKKIDRDLSGEIQKDLTKDTDKIIATVGRIAKIISGLKSFSRNSDQDPFLPVQIKTVVENTLALCHDKMATGNITFEMDSIPEFTVMGREGQLVQVLLNLITNSLDAIELSPVKVIQLQFSKIQNQIQIRVRDSGTPIQPEVYSRLMDPFFTTKEIGKGTGLGLSISKGLTEEHQGHLFLDTNSPNTCFVIQLPEARHFIQPAPMSHEA